MLTSWSPSPGPGLVIADALVTTGMATAGVTGGLFLCYWLCRGALDHRRLAAWESAWARTGPRWTSRR